MTLDPTYSRPDFVVQKRAALAAGTKAGRFELRSLLGAGGMGEVYLAHDPDLGRDVAIKVLQHAGRSSEALLREAQAMARLSHPNVVVIYEVGTLDDQVYLAMEYVNGTTLRAWLAAARRGWREVLPVFIAAGRGLAAAHRARIVHRDFKPDNVLIGGDGRVRVADFGLAGESLEISVEEPPPAVTGTDTLRFSAAASGTPAYMSPEQHLRQALDPRSDQFAFCVALHEALYGARPFSGDSLDALRKSILAHEVAPPPRASEVPAWVRTIVLRGLHVDREQRWPSMEALVAALEADPALRRRRVALGAGVAGAIGLAAYGLLRPAAAPSCDGGEARLAGVWDVAAKQRLGAALPADTAARVERALDGYTARWTAMRRDACEATSVRHDQSAELLDLRMACLDRRLGGVRELVGLLGGPVDAELARRAADAAYQLDDLQPCADREALTAVIPPPSTPEARRRVEALGARIDKLKALELAGRYREGAALGEAVLVEARAAGHAPALAAALYRVATIARGKGDFVGAQARASEAVEVAAAARDGAMEAQALGLLYSLIGWDRGKPAEAAPMLPALRAALSRAGEDVFARAAIHGNVASVMQRQGRWPESVEEGMRGVRLLEERAESPQLAAALNRTAVGLRRMGHPEESLVALQRARDIWIRTLGPDNNKVGGASMNACNTLKDLGRNDEALAMCRASVETFERALGGEHTDVARALSNTASILDLLGRHDEARGLAERALAIKEKALGPDHPDTANSVLNVGTQLSWLGRHAEALALQERALAIRTKALGPGHELVVESQVEVAQALLAVGRLKEARALADRALAAAGPAGTPDGPPGANALIADAKIALAERRPAAALAAADRAIAVYEKQLPNLLGEPLVARGRALLELGRFAEALETLERASKVAGVEPAVVQPLVLRARSHSAQGQAARSSRK